MKFNFIHAGKRFFFITLVVKGRRALLSRRVRDEIVELLPEGQRVKDHWATSHQRSAAVTASNFILMPDHAHFLLLPYGLAPRYDPSVEDSRHLAEGRELILSAFPTSVPSSPISRANCLAMNDRIAALCARASELGARRAGEHGFGGAAPEPPLRGVAIGARGGAPQP